MTGTLVRETSGVRAGYATVVLERGASGVVAWRGRGSALRVRSASALSAGDARRTSLRACPASGLPTGSGG